MGGVVCGWLIGYVQYVGFQFELEEMYGCFDFLFYGVNFELIFQNFGELMERLMCESVFIFGVIIDGDVDWVGVIMVGGYFFNSYQIFVVLIKYFYGCGVWGWVVKIVLGS